MNENYGERDWELPCVCGHLKSQHLFEPYIYIKGINGEDSHCSVCYAIRYLKPVHKFKLDNLALVEQLARARKLI